MQILKVNDGKLNVTDNNFLHFVSNNEWTQFEEKTLLADKKSFFPKNWRKKIHYMSKIMKFKL